MIPIPGTKRPHCADENLASLKVQLSAEECRELEDAVPHDQVWGMGMHLPAAHPCCPASGSR